MRIDIQSLISALTPFFWRKKGNNELGGNILPDAPSAYDIGSATRPLRKVYVSELVGTAGYLDELVAPIPGGTPGYLGNVLNTTGDVTITSNASNVTLGVAGTILRADGSVALSGNLPVSNGVTIDGVDLSAHAADPAAHHDPVTAGALISLSGQEVSLRSGTSQYQVPVTGASPFTPSWSLLSNFAGNGMSFSSGKFVVGVANTGAAGLTQESTQIRLTSSSNPGGTSSVLASDANGYLQLVRLGIGMSPSRPLDVTGNIGVTGQVIAGSLAVSGAATINGDLTVGTVLQVSASGTRVGINRAADQQFDLDVAGSIRGQYIVGKHAIQLTDAALVIHYDGPAPYNLDYTGSAVSYNGVAGTASNVIYTKGKFGKAVQVAKSTTNLVTNPSFEVGLSGWNISGSTRVTTGGKYGSSYLNAGTFAYVAVPVTNGQSYALSFYHRGQYSCNINYGNGTINPFSGTTDVDDDGWARFTVKFTASGSTCYLYLYNYDYDAVQIENSTFVTPYCDGSLGTGHSWSGTAHQSTSTRSSSGSITYPINALKASAGTVAMWVRYYDVNTSGGVLFSAGSANAELDAYIATPDSVIYRIKGAATNSYVMSSYSGDWVHLAFSWNNGVSKLYINGIKRNDGSYTGTPTLHATQLGIGYSPIIGLTYVHNGMIDDVVVLDYAADDDLIAAIYESDAPVFVESSVFHWRSPSRVPIWVDEFGLWARGVSGNEILGLYGGDPRDPLTATYQSWGGINLYENDILIGRSSGGYLFWDDSAQTMNLKGTMIIDGNSYFNGVVTIGTSGEIRQGTGTLGSNFTGLRIWRDSGTGVGRIAGYNNNTSQWYAGTDGKLYAAGGSVWMDNSGLSILGTSLRIMESAATVKGYLYGANPSDGSWSNYPGMVLRTNGISSTESVSIRAHSTTTSNSEFVMYSGATGSVLPQIRLFAYNGTANSGLLFLSSSTFEVYTNGYITPRLSIDSGGTVSVTNNMTVGGTFNVTGAVGGTWVSLTPGNNWSNFGTPNVSLSYLIFGNTVSIRGVIRAGAAIATNVAISNTQLPSNVRPSTNAGRSFVCIGTISGVKAVSRAYVDSSGYIRLQDAFATNDWMAIEFTYFN